MGDRMHMCSGGGSHTHVRGSLGGHARMRRRGGAHRGVSHCIALWVPVHARFRHATIKMLAITGIGDILDYSFWAILEGLNRL